MGKSLVVARDLPSGHVLTARRHRDEVARRRHPALRAATRCSAWSRCRPLHEDDFLIVRRAGQARRRSSPVRERERSFQPRRPDRRRHRRVRQARPDLGGGAARRGRARGRARPARRARRRRRFARWQRARRGTARQRFDCDITNRESIEARGAGRRDAAGRAATVLVNNAGIDQPPDSPGGNAITLDDLPIDEFRRMVEVNLLGTFQVTQVFGALMAHARRRVDHQHRLALRVGVARSALLRSPRRQRAVSQVAGLRRVEGRRRQPDEVSSPRTGARTASASTRCRRAACSAGRTSSSRRSTARACRCGRMARGRRPEGSARVPRLAAPRRT